MSSVGSRGKGLGLRLTVPVPVRRPQAQPLPLPSGPEEIQLSDLDRENPPLGTGSSGRVYKVIHRQTGRAYALKIIQEKHEEEVRRQILNEMAILRRARCPQIVQCFGVYDTRGEISFVLELMDVGSLADVMRRQGPISEQFIAEITRQVLKGLEYLHRQHVVHRDIKPSNLLINSSGEVKIADFGVSTMLLNTMAQCSSFVGTSAYLSPERINPPPTGDGQYNAYASDIWSLGLTLLELAMGRYPYFEVQPGQVPNWMALYGAIVYNPPPQAPPRCSANFRDFISRCLEKDVALRPSIARLIAHPFAAMYQEERYQDLRNLLALAR